MLSKSADHHTHKHALQSESDSHHPSIMSSHNEESIQEAQIPEASIEIGSEEAKKSKPEHEAAAEETSGGREKLKRHRVEVAGRVWIPDMWGQEELLKDWIDCAAFDAALVSSSIIMARDSLREERRRANSATLRIQN